jgi:hypothetical protein
MCTCCYTVLKTDGQRGELRCPATDRRTLRTLRQPLRCVGTGWRVSRTTALEITANFKPQLLTFKINIPTSSKLNSNYRFVVRFTIERVMCPLTHLYRIKKKVIFNGGVDRLNYKSIDWGRHFSNILKDSFFRHFLLLVSLTEQPTVKRRFVIHYFAFYTYNKRITWK